MTGDTSKIEELKTLLVEQIRRAQSDDLESLLPTIERADKLMRQLDRTTSEQLDEIRELHRRLRLTVADKKWDISEKLSAIRGAKRLIRAYGENVDDAR